MVDIDDIPKEKLAKLTIPELEEFFIARFADRNLGLSKVQLMAQALIIHAHMEVEEQMENLIASALSTGLPSDAAGNVYKKICKLSFGWKQELIESMFPNTRWSAFIKTLNGFRTKVAHIDRKSKKSDAQDAMFNGESIYTFTGISNLLLEARETSKILWLWTNKHFKPLAEKVQGWQRAEVLSKAVGEYRKTGRHTKESK